MKEYTLTKKQLKQLDDFEFVMDTDYGCDGQSEQCCGNCGGERLNETRTKDALVALIAKMITEAVKKAKKSSVKQ